MCAFAINSNAQQQTSVRGTPGITGVGGYIKNVREMEESPANIRFKGEPKIVEQFYNDEQEEREKDGSYAPATTFNLYNPNNATAQVKYITPENVVEPPQPVANKVTSQHPAYTALGNTQGGLDPSDAQIAAGPAHIVVLANDDAKIINKLTGAVISDVTLAAFAGWSGFIFDPRIMYDPYAQRWVAFVLQSSGCNSDSKFRVLVSNNSDPTQGWYWYERDVDANNQTWMDFAKIGFNKDYICVSGNVRCGSQPIGLYVFNKAQVYAGATASTWWWNSIELGNPSFTFDNSIDRLFITQTGNANSGGTGYVNSWYISGATSPSLTSSYSYGTSAWQASATNAAACPKQLGGSATFTAVNTFGHAIFNNCVYRNGFLWFTHAVFLPATGTTTRVSTQWWQVNPATGAVNQVGRIDDGTGATSEYYQSITVNAYNDAVVTYSIFNASYYQSAAYNYRNSADPSGHLPNGVFYYSGGSYDADGRGGDYSQCAIDPLDDNAMWVVNQIPNGSWETRFTVLPGYFGCYTDVTFGNNNWSGITKNEASSSITSAEMIQPNSMVDYDAGSYIVMSPGFVANQGSNFTAIINGCGGYRLGHTKTDGEISANDLLTKTVTDPGTALEFSIYPNPSNGNFSMNFVAIDDGNISIKIYDSKMNLIATVADNSFVAKGVYNKNVDLSHFAEGLYFCRVEANNKVFTRKIQVVK